MRTVGLLAGAGLLLAGLVWLAQGLNLSFAPRSFMTADRSWIVLGSATAVVGVAIIAWAWRRR